MNEKIKLQKVVFHNPKAVYGQTTSFLPNEQKKRLGPSSNGTQGVEVAYLPGLECVEVKGPEDWPDLLIPISAVWQMQKVQSKKDPASGPEVLSQAQIDMLKAQPAEPEPRVPVRPPEGSRDALSPAPPPDLRPPPKADRVVTKQLDKPKLSDKLDGKLKKKRGRPKKVKKDETD